VKDIFIDVLDRKQKILILADAPHPDIAAIKNSIEDNAHYEVVSVLAENAQQINNLFSYNLVILHQLPSVKNKIEKSIAEIEKSKIPVLFILGNQVSIQTLNAVQNVLNISSSGGKTSDAVPILSKDFTLFTISDEIKNFLPKLSPLQCPFGNYKVAPSAEYSGILFQQKIGSVETSQPLWFFTNNLERKTGFILGEGIWRWRLLDFAAHGNSALFNELIDKTIQYLSLKADKRLFRVISKNIFYENQQVEFDAELYNDSYELINQPEVTLTIINSDGKKFPFSFTRTTNAYHLNAGNFPVGAYRYEAKVNVGNKIFTQKGEFVIAPLQIETTNTIADHQLLYSLAKKSGGELIYPNQLNKLAQLLTSRKDIKPIRLWRKELSDLINLKWIFFLLLFLLSAEWLIRKINGAY
jgi:hypothetical protein